MQIVASSIHVSIFDATGGELDGKRFVVLRVPLAAGGWMDLGFTREEAERIGAAMLEGARQVAEFEAELEGH